MRRIFILSTLCLLFSATARTQTDSSGMEVSLLTCAPGADLYSLFGHTAIRLRDTKKGMDIVFNYGTFDPEDPLFYFNFTRGIMVYSLAEQRFPDFMQEYEEEHRGVSAQILDLTPIEKTRLLNALDENAQDQHRFYNYHFYADNCTTRAGNILARAKDSLVFRDIYTPPRPTYRQSIHAYLDRQHRDWAKFGIDVMLGAHLDQSPDLQQERWLPDLLAQSMDLARAHRKPFVLAKETLLEYKNNNEQGGFFTPLVFGWALFAVGCVLSFLKNKFSIRALFVLDILFFGTLGIMGCIMAYVWIARVDTVCRNNLNLAWAIPFHLIAVFAIRRNNRFVGGYFLATGMLALFILVGWLWWPQELNAAVIPLCGLIALRAFSIFFQWKNKSNSVARR